MLFSKIGLSLMLTVFFIFADNTNISETRTDSTIVKEAIDSMMLYMYGNYTYNRYKTLQLTGQISNPKALKGYNLKVYNRYLQLNALAKNNTIAQGKLVIEESNPFDKDTNISSKPILYKDMADFSNSTFKLGQFHCFMGTFGLITTIASLTVVLINVKDLDASVYLPTLIGSAYSIVLCSWEIGVGYNLKKSSIKYLK